MGGGMEPESNFFKLLAGTESEAKKEKKNKMKEMLKERLKKVQEMDQAQFKAYVHEKNVSMRKSQEEHERDQLRIEELEGRKAELEQSIQSCGNELAELQKLADLLYM